MSSQVSWFRDTFLQKAKLWLGLYLLVLPVVGSLLVFAYYPKIDVVIMSFYRWTPPTVQEYIGLKNFQDAFADPTFWASFRLVAILLLANLVKMWPAVFAAIALHRLASDKLRYTFQVLFVVPMIIPSIVGLLVWKSFFDPDFGLLNKFLSATGLMGVLHWMDSTMPAMALAMAPFFKTAIDPVFGSIYGLAWLGGIIWALSLWKDRTPNRWNAYASIVASGALFPATILPGLASTMAGGLGTFGLFVVTCLWMARVMGRQWILWPFFILGGVVIFWDGLWRLPLWLAGGLLLNEWIRSRQTHFFASSTIAWVGIGVLSLSSLLVLLGKVWITQTGQFALGSPAWLGNQDLVIPSLLFWGFPWVGTVGVLIYLSGLQNIPQDVYEAAELDGVSPFKMLFLIELPLIMTQFRINLIFMTISTLTGYEMFLLLLGPDGGPGNKGMVPGLYLFSSAFSEGKFGYGCALGMVLFVIIMALTIVYQKYVKVDK